MRIDMSKIAPEKFIECVERSGLVAKDELARALAFWKGADPAAFDDSERFAISLIETKLLTRWQADNLLLAKSSGFILGQFKLLNVLGTGRSWSVYLAEHAMTHMLRAIIVLPVSRVNNSPWLARFLHLAMATANVKHPNITLAYDINREKKHHYVVMEYVEERVLRAFVELQGPLDPQSAADFVRQAAQGLAHAHARGLVHRDIKPNHLMIEKQGTVKLLDWSMSRFIGEQTAPLTAADDESRWTTFDYLAPEQSLDVDLVDPRTDIYGLGCTLHYLLTGRPPFASRPQIERPIMHQSSKRPNVRDERPDVPQPLAELCSRMMARSPDERPQGAAAVVAKLVAIFPDNSDPSVQAPN
jgi:eukaryotic-like serine/threonine-protein kinase